MRSAYSPPTTLRRTIRSRGCGCRRWCSAWRGGRREFGFVAAPFFRIGRRKRVTRRRERRIERHVPSPSGELAQTLGRALWIGADFAVGNRAPSVGRQLDEVVEDLRIRVDPLA